MTTPTNDLAALSQRIVEALYGSLLMPKVTVVAMHLAPTLDEMAKWKAVVAANDAKELERAGNPMDSPQFELRMRVMDAEEALAQSEASCAALRSALDRVSGAYARILRYSGERPDEDEYYTCATAALATDAGKALIDELERLRAEMEECNFLCVNSAGGGRVSDVLARMLNELRQRAESAESALRSAQENAEAIQDVAQRLHDHGLVVIKNWRNLKEPLGHNLANAVNDFDRIKQSQALAAQSQPPTI